MKKGLFIIIAFLMAATLVACKPHGMNSETYEYGQKALEIIEKYNDAEISADEAADRIESINDHLKSLSLTDEIEDIKNQSMILSLDSVLISLQYGGDTYRNEESIREHLK